MATPPLTISPRISDLFRLAQQFSAEERLVLAKLLLDSLVANEARDESDWLKLSLASFETDWDNPDDAIYDDWRELYDLQTR
ncbi:MAG: hypothetical protein HYR94_13280 [Chloroflexi bacterium]|nr:hypothetical protein [Chloroflexota bacterium]